MCFYYFNPVLAVRFLCKVFSRVIKGTDLQGMDPLRDVVAEVKTESGIQWGGVWLHRVPGGSPVSKLNLFGSAPLNFPTSYLCKF